jgi:endonuclease/exonuclease/phosphatase family metal-dependent hydrolase
MRLGAAPVVLCLSVLAAGVSVGATSTAASPAGFVIASLNMAGQPRIADALASWVRTRGLDVVLLQEVGGHGVDGAAFVAALGERLGYHSAYAPADQFGDQTQGLAIVSRGPIDDVRIIALDRHHLRFKSRCRIAMAATIGSPAGPVRVVNVHLDTRINSKDRVAQLAPVIDALDDDAGPQVLGGDFNTMDVGWLHTVWPFPGFQHQAAAVRTRLAESAFHTPFMGGPATFKFFGLPIRLDWLYLKQLQAADWSVDEVPLSDHRGVWARLK